MHYRYDMDKIIFLQWKIKDTSLLIVDGEVGVELVLNHYVQMADNFLPIAPGNCHDYSEAKGAEISKSTIKFM